MAGCSYFIFIFLEDFSLMDNSENLQYHVPSKKLKIKTAQSRLLTKLGIIEELDEEIVNQTAGAQRR